VELWYWSSDSPPAVLQGAELAVVSSSLEKWKRQTPDSGQEGQVLDVTNEQDNAFSRLLATLII